MKAPEVTLELVGTRAGVKKHACDLLRSLLPDSNPDDGVFVAGDGAGAWILSARAYRYEGEKIWVGALVLVSRKENGE